MNVLNKSNGIVLVWYYHLPSLSSENEVQDLIDSSINPLLAAHDETKVPFTLAITGSLLQRMKGYPNTLSLIKELADNGIIEISSTFFYEIYPPIIPLRFLTLQLVEDIKIKRDIFNIAPVSFYPPNFTWISVFEPLLKDLDIRNIILDSSHYAHITKTQLWKWHSQTKSKLSTFLKETVVDSQEAHRIYRFSQEESWNNKLNSYIFFRDFEAVQKLSFGNTGMFHQPYNLEELEDYIADTFSNLRSNEFITIADDGDRINPVSIQNYTYFLKRLNKNTFKRIADLADNQYSINDLPYIPSFSIGDHQTFWLSDLDCVHYINLMEQLYNLNDNKSNKDLDYEIMELQDVYFLFWKTISRKKYYIEKIYNLLKSHI